MRWINSIQTHYMKLTNTFRYWAITMGIWTQLWAALGAGQDGPAPQPGILRFEFIAERPAFASSHASTIEDTPAGLVSAWFGGPEEGHTNVVIYVSRHEAGQWTTPAEVANGLQPGGAIRYPCWNPVLYQAPNGPLVLFYKVGPKPSNWWGMRMESADSGKTWSAPSRLPENILGPVRNKAVPLAKGGLLCGSSTEDHGWRLHMEWTPDLGKTWERTAALNDGREFGAIQPTILAWPEGRVQLLNRTRQGAIAESWMQGDWRNWSPLKAISLPNPNSGIDGLVLRDGRALLVYNHTKRGRSPLNVAVSADGKNWKSALVLENLPGEYSYPAVIQSRDGMVHITYTWHREKIRHVVVDPSKLVLVDPAGSKK